MHPIYSLFYQSWRLTALTLLLILLAGTTSMLGLPKQEDPYIAERFGIVTTFMPGASAERVETLITDVLEQELRQIEEIDDIDSSSLPGASILSVNLADDTPANETDQAWSLVRDRLAAAAELMPAGAGTPELEGRIIQAHTLLLSLSWQDDNSDLRILQRLAEDLALRLNGVPGTRSVELFGTSEERVLAEVDVGKMTAAGITVADLARAAADRDRRRPTGRVEAATNRLALELAEHSGTLEQVRQLRLQVNNQLSVQLSDIAQVSKSRGEPPDTLTLLGGKPSVMLGVRTEISQRVDAWVELVQTELAAFSSDLPEQIELRTVYDQSAYTDDRLNTLTKNLAFTAVIVLLTLVFFQGLRPAAVIALALPLTCLGTLALMRPLDISLQQMSVTGLIIALGLLIDNPIVVIDHYQRLRRENLGMLEAIRKSVSGLRIPLLASTLTTIFAFMPIATGSGPTSEFVGSMALVVVLAVAMSLFLSLTVIPALNAYLEQFLEPRFGLQRWSRGYHNPRLEEVYRRSLMLVMRKPWVGLAIAMTMPALGFMLFPTLQRNFFPPVDRDMFQISLQTWTAGSLPNTREQVEKVRQVILEYPETESDFWFLGEAAARPFYNVAGVTTSLKGAAVGYAYTSSAEATAELLPKLQRRLRDEFPGLRLQVSPFAQGPPVSAPLELILYGEDLELLRAKGEELRALMLSLNQVTYANADMSDFAPRIRLYPSEADLTSAGVDDAQISQLLAAALDGIRAGTLLDGSYQLPIEIRLPAELRADWQQLLGVPLLRDAAGRLIPLDALAESRFETSTSSIDHEGGLRSNSIRGWLSPFALASDSLPLLQEKIAESGFSLPQGMQMEIGGESAESSDSIATLLQTATFFLMLMLFSIVLSFSSFKDAGLVSLTAFLSTGLAIFGLVISGNIFGFNAIIGMLGLVGLAINGTIVVLSQLKNSPEAMAGDPKATCETVIRATRHILATTATTVFGFVPLILSNQTFWHPLVWAIAGGVAGSAIIALYMVPALFRLRTRNLATA